MKKWFSTVLIIVIVTGGVLWTGTEAVYAKEQKGGINPDSPLYILDRMVENVTVLFLPEDKKVDFHLQVSRERFAEALEMQNRGKSDKASTAFNDGLKSVGKVLGAWKSCLEKEIDLSGLKADLRNVLAEAKKTFDQLKKEFKPEKIGDFLRELAEITKLQIEVLFSN